MSQPASQTVTVGQQATFSAVASGSVPLAYQWIKNGASISGATEPTYTTPPATTSDSGAQLAIVVHNSAGSVTSAPATLTVTDPSKTTPTITWGNPADIAYGTPLGASQLNATASVAGTFVYTPAAGTVLSAGVQSLHVEFIPTDAANYNPASKDVQIIVLKVTPTVTWSNPADIAYDTPLGGAQLNATASVAGTFVYTPAAGTVLSTGVQGLHVDFSPTDVVNFNGTSRDVQISVSKATPTITWARPADIAYGTPLSGTQLNATASVPGAFVYTPATGMVLDAGVQTLHVDFSPTDAVNFTPASKDVQINVSKITPTIAWANPSEIAYGTALGGVQLNATASVPGTFVYTPATGTVLDAGVQTLHVDFSPTDAVNFTPASKDVQINVGKVTPTITWSNPAKILYGMPLSATQLDATGSVPGTFVYTPAAGTVLNAGVQTLHVDFTPNDAVNFNGATKDVQINVVEETPLGITVTPDPAGVTVGDSIQFTATGTFPDGMTFDLTGLAAWESDDATIAIINSAGLATGLTLGGPVTLTATYSGISGTTILKVGKPVITSHPISQTVPMGDTVTFTVAAMGPAPLSYQWLRNGDEIPNATSSSYSTATSEDDDAAEFAVVVSNDVGSVTSNPAIVSLLFPTEILTPPENQTVAAGQTATFMVEARGSYGLSYQWQEKPYGAADFADIPGATVPIYVTPPTSAADQRTEFAVRVSDNQGIVLLASSVLTVTPTSPAIYYIDYLAGDDNNDGTAKSAPWRHAPGMSGCEDVCLASVIHPGDHIIFQGWCHVGSCKLSR